MKDLIVLCLVAFLNQASFAQQTSGASAPVAEKKACCAPGAAKAGASCSGMAAANTSPAAAATVAQTTGTVKETAATAIISQTAQFQVWGNCGMCKKTIEKAAKGVTGVQSVNWNMDTHQFTVTFDPAQTSVDKVHQAIAAAGYDTDVVKGNDEAYNNLHGCCQYERRQ